MMIILNKIIYKISMVGFKNILSLNVFIMQFTNIDVIEAIIGTGYK